MKWATSREKSGQRAPVDQVAPIEIFQGQHMYLLSMTPEYETSDLVSGLPAVTSPWVIPSGG